MDAGMKIPMDAEGWAARTDLGHLVQGGEVLFIVPGEAQVIPAKIVGGDIELFPERFMMHRTLCAALGQPYIPPEPDPEPEPPLPEAA
jgi:hypothetical protein